ncbi:MAG: hypothetical protein ACLFVJ_07260 [Persicimonas sp.]
MNHQLDHRSPLVNSAWTRLIVWVCAAATALAAGCGDEAPQGPPPTHQFKLEVSVTDEGENPIPKAPVVLDGKTVGYTDRDGLFQAVLNEQDGAEVQLSIGKMDDYMVPEDAEQVETLKLKKSLEGAMKPVPVSMHTTLRSMRTDYLVWLDVECDEFLDDKCAELPVMVNGEERTRTDHHGAAHFVVTDVPESTLEITIETPQYEPSADDDEDSSFVMKPKNPTYEVELGLESEVLLIKESFKDPVAAEKAAEARKKRARLRRIRRARANRNAQKPKKKEKKKDDGVIDLW